NAVSIGCNKWIRAGPNGRKKPRSCSANSKNWKSTPRACSSRSPRKKKAELPVLLDPADDPVDPRAYGIGMQVLFVRLVLAGTSLRRAARVLALLAEVLGWCLPTPHWTTGRLWLLRLGHATLTLAKIHADD